MSPTIKQKTTFKVVFALNTADTKRTLLVQLLVM